MVMKTGEKGEILGAEWALQKLNVIAIALTFFFSP
jgi:hypothetical protein